MVEATMNKKYAFMLLVFFVAVIAISGCTSTTTTPTTTKTGAFAGGTEGLAVSLLNTEQFSQLYENNKFSIFVQVQNKGEGNLTPIVFGGGGNPSKGVGQGVKLPGGLLLGSKGTTTGMAVLPMENNTIYGYISLGGININSWSTLQYQYITKQLTPTKKITNQIVQGAPEQITFDAIAPPIEGAQLQYKLQVSALYGYSSKATAMACLKENPYQQTVSGKEMCKITGALSVEASGAPIKVTSIDENPSGFLIKVKNVGTGYPFKIPSTFPQMEEDLTLGDKNKVTIESVKLEDVPITCAPEDIYIGSNNEGQFSCTADLKAISGTALEQLVIRLNYGYITTTSTTLNVIGTD